MHRKGFTLIELLIVVAIIAILAAIAVPNFLEAQTRSKISRVRSDMRTQKLAVEAYSVDNNKYPRVSYPNPPYNDQINGEYVYNTLTKDITTPIAYLSSITLDTFAHRDATILTDKMFQYGEIKSIRDYRRRGLPEATFPGESWTANYGNEFTCKKMERYMGAYYLWSHGPLGTQFFTGGGDTERYFLQYDPTNGTNSEGRIYIAQKFNEFIEWIPPRIDHPL